MSRLSIPLRLRLCVWGATLAAAAGSGPAFAEEAEKLFELSLEDLGKVKVDQVFAASRYTENVTEAPSSVSIVTRNEIRQFGYRTLAEIIRATRGFDITYDRNYTYTGVRGFNRFGDYGSKVLLLIDGHRMNDLIYDALQVGTEALLDVDLIERVEFVRGPGSSLYGSNAFFGVISITTRRGGEVQAFETAGSFGSFDARSGRTTFGGKFANGVELLLSGSGYASDGEERLFFPEYASPETNFGNADRRDGDRAWNFLGSLSYRQFTLRGGFVTREKDVPTASYGTQFNGLSSTLDERGFAELVFAHQTQSDWTLGARASYDTYHYQGFADYDDASGRQIRNDDSGDASWFGLEAGASHIFSQRFRFTLGAEYRRSMELAQFNFDRSPRFVYAEVSGTQEVFGAYTEGNLEFTKWFKVVAGLRYDHYNTFGETVNPRAAAIFQPWKRTSFKLLYGEAFRAPNSYETTYAGFGQIANPALQPEEIRTFELVAEQYFDAHWRAAASLFRNDIRALVTTETDVDGNLIPLNGGAARVHGAEVEIEGKWKSGALFRASYTRHLAEESERGETLENSPKDTLRAQLALPIFGEKLSAGIGLLYQSERLTILRQKTSAPWLITATLLSRELRPGLEISASIYNLLDTRYSVPGNAEHLSDQLEQEGRTFRLKVQYRF